MSYAEHAADMAWMFSPTYGFHTQADREANADYQWSIATLIGLASIPTDKSRRIPVIRRPITADLQDVAWFLAQAKREAKKGNAHAAMQLIEDAECYLADAYETAAE